MKYTTFSERQASRRGEYPPKPLQKTFSEHLRRNIAMIFSETLGVYYDGEVFGFDEPVRTTKLWIAFDRHLRYECEEYAIFAEQNRNRKANWLILAFIANASDGALLDFLDMGIAVIEQLVRPLQQQYSNYLRDWKVQLTPDGALASLDERLRGAGTIYRIVDGALIISTDDMTHEEAIRPALQCLGEDGFAGAAQEFHEALTAYRKGHFDQVLTKANHAFESTMKVIVGKMGWDYDKTATAAKLIDVMFENALLPRMRESALTSLRTLLKSDVPTIRNKMPSAGHGRGEQTDAIPEPIAAYALNAAAANIRLLVESYRLKRVSR